MDYQALSIWILATSGGVVSATQWLKGVLKVKGKAALVLSAIVSVIGAIVTLWSTGQFLPSNAIGWQDVVALFMAIFPLAQGFYFAKQNKT